jgi:hypothetical protein
MTRSASIHSEPRGTRKQSEHAVRLVGDAFRWRISGRLVLDTRTADGEGDVDVSARGSGVRAGFVCEAHQVERFVVADLRRVEVERSREAEAALVDGTDPDVRGDARAGQVELASESSDCPGPIL